MRTFVWNLVPIISKLQTRTTTVCALASYKQHITWWVQCSVEKRIHYQSCAWHIIVDVSGSVHLRQWVSVGLNVFRGLLNVILDQLSPCHVCQTEAEPHLFSSPLTVQPSTFCSELEKSTKSAVPLRHVRLHAHTRTLTQGETEMLKAPAPAPQACSALIWTNP